MTIIINQKSSVYKALIHHIILTANSVLKNNNKRPCLVLVPIFSLTFQTLVVHIASAYQANFPSPDVGKAKYSLLQVGWLEHLWLGLNHQGEQITISAHLAMLKEMIIQFLGALATMLLRHLLTQQTHLHFNMYKYLVSTLIYKLWVQEQWYYMGLLLKYIDFFFSP